VIEKISERVTTLENYNPFLPSTLIGESGAARRPRAASFWVR
jgi:hypothetical protein